MSDDDWPEWRVDELRVAVDAWLQARADRTFIEIIDTIDAHPAVTLGPDDVVLLGFEENIDAVMSVPKPRPIALRRPLPPRPTAARCEDLWAPAFRIAQYVRVGERTYQRDH